MWTLFAYSPDVVSRSFDVPIEYRNVPPNRRIQPGTHTVRVRLSCPDHAFRRLDPAQKAVALVLDQPHDGENRLTIDRSNVSIPDQSTPDCVDPEVVEVSARFLPQPN